MNYGSNIPRTTGLFLNEFGEPLCYFTNPIDAMLVDRLLFDFMSKAELLLLPEQVSNEVKQEEPLPPPPLLGVAPVDQGCADTTSFEPVTAEAQRLVYGDRRADYGDAFENCAKTADLWAAYLGCPIQPRDVPLMMILMKISRELSGTKRDNRVDIAGYAEVLEMIEQHKAKQDSEW